MMPGLPIPDSASNSRPRGDISLVGAGPGDPELLTLKAFRLIREADVVIYDNLVGPRILDLIPEHAERIFVGKQSSKHTLPQSKINDLLLDFAAAGKRVVRLKGGDPFVFGRGGEELTVLHAAGVAVEVVPGITAALGAGASFGFPLTHRDHAQSCVFVTGHLQDSAAELDWHALASPRQTLVIYMGIAGLVDLVRQLIAHGLARDTPAALIHKATLPEQRLCLTNLAELPETARREAFTPPSLVVVGRVLTLSKA